MLGLDRFKAVNHSLGLLTADRLLIAVAGRLHASLRSTDAVTRAEHRFTLARLGGDEFTVLLDDIADVSDAVRVAERLRSALEKPFDVDGLEVFTSASVGIAVSTTGYERPEQILRDAAIALHRAKAEGASHCELFDSGMRDRAISRLQLETDLRRAIEHRDVRDPLPADRLALDRRDRRVRGADAVAAPRARATSARPSSSRLRRTPG